MSSNINTEKGADMRRSPQQSSRMPSAPYPPLINAPLLPPPALPVPNLKNVLTSNNKNHNSGISNKSNSNIGLQHPIRRQQRGIANNETSNTFDVPQLEFSPIYPNVYGCINCQQSQDDNTFDANGRSTSTPNLLEIREIKRILKPQRGFVSYSNLLGISEGPADLRGALSTCISFHQPQFSHFTGSSPMYDFYNNKNISAKSYESTRNSGQDTTMYVATGLDNGSLCLHSFPNFNINNVATEPSLPEAANISNSSVQLSSVRFYHVNRQHRQSTCVAWAPSSSSQRSSNMIAIGLQSQTFFNKRSSRGDREACCLVWDVECGGNNSTSGNTGNGSGKGTGGPVYKFAHHSGVSSLSWLPHLSPLSGPGQTLLVGCQTRQIQLYDLRVTGSARHSPPVSIEAHSDAVNGIKVDPNRPHLFASFSKQTFNSRNNSDPVKLWDARNLERSVGEIKVNAGSVSDIAWSSISIGALAVAMGDTIRYFDTSTSMTRPTLTRMNYCAEEICCIAVRPKIHAPKNLHSIENKTPISRSTEVYKGDNLDEKLDFFSLRNIVVSKQGIIYDLAKFQIAPLSLSNRDGRICRSYGRAILMGGTSQGVSSMENLKYFKNEDISATMMRRARCLHVARYSTDAAANLRMLSEEESSFSINDDNANEDIESLISFPLYNSREALWRLWSWIERVEMLSMTREDIQSVANSSVSKRNLNEEILWKANGLLDSGVSQLLRINIDEDIDDNHVMDLSTFSEVLGCDVFESHMRCAALTACGWLSRYGLHSILADCEARDHFERSAALAVFHGELGSAFSALQRGAEVLKESLIEDKHIRSPVEVAVLSQYVEILQLVAMCIAGYNGSKYGNDSNANVWRYSCESILQRPELSINNTYGGVPYLRAACTFLCNIGTQHDDWYAKVLEDDNLSLCDRVAFACRFLPRKNLRNFLYKSIHNCMDEGNVEGIVITGLGKQGIELLQAYVDKYSDVQTAALVSSRVTLPSAWMRERAACSEWLDSYRDLLNTWQMWQSRAMFDVGRAELLRHLVNKQHLEKERFSSNAASSRSLSHNNRRMNVNTMRKQPSMTNPRQSEINKFIPSSPPQVYARCNYCNTGLPLNKLRRQEGMANSWLSRQKPVLSCCPQCRKPLPRCSVCLLPMGCLNPYLELKRERNKVSRTSRQRSSLNDVGDDDLSGLTNLPFAEWFTWCMRCKHGGHAHHLVGWFANHDTCPVSTCDCRCQFDGIQKLNRPALQCVKINED